MNFKSIGLKTAVATAVVAGSALAISPAQAGNLFPGTFTIGGTSSITADSKTDPNFTISFANFSISEIAPGNVDVSPKGVFDGNLTGTPFVGSLGLQRVGTTTMYNITSGLNGFVTGLQQKGKSIVLNLAAGSQLNGSISNVNNQYSFDGDLFGTLAFTDSSSSAPAGVGLGAFRFRVGNGNSATVSVATVPTPALLPGLLALGVGVLRKRKAEAAEEVKADA